MKHLKIRCLITAGPTREYFDPVRFISNPSSGKMGYAMAEAALARGWQVDLVTGPVALSVPDEADVHRVVTGEDMYEVCARIFPECDILIMCAAVCDMRPKIYFDKKVKKDQIAFHVDFEPTRDILSTLSKRRSDRQRVIGFAAETDHVESYALKKLNEKNLDWIIANSVAKGGAFESDSNCVQLFGRDGTKRCFGPNLKTVIAEDLIAEMDAQMQVMAG